MKKILALFFALAMIASFVTVFGACGSESESIGGTYYVTRINGIPLEEYVRQAVKDYYTQYLEFVGEELPDYIDEMIDKAVAEEIDGYKNCYITLNSDGTVTTYDGKKDGASGTWTLDGDVLTIKTEGGVEHKATFNGDSFVVTEDEVSMTMTFEKN